MLVNIMLTAKMGFSMESDQKKLNTRKYFP